MTTRWHWEWWFWGDNWLLDTSVDLTKWGIAFEKGYGSFGIGILCLWVRLDWPYEEPE